MNNGETTLKINTEIKSPQVRVVLDNGESQVMSIGDALASAYKQNLDLVLINDHPTPPICKIVDVEKYQYSLKRKEKETARAQRNSRVEIKEVQFTPNINTHDFDTKCRNILKFIEKGHKVKLLVQFRGRERQFSDLGFDVINRVVTEIHGVEFDGSPQFSGNRITAIIKGTKDGTTAI
jgi:translation initiation factor IF-3